MTVLFVDAGNTRVKFGWRVDRGYDDDANPREASQVAFTYEELPAQLPAWLRTLTPAPHAALGTNVAGMAIEQLIVELLAQAGCAISWIHAGASRLGVVNGYREPTQLGADRWVAMIGIWALAQRHARLHGASPSAHLLAHFGTATTLDTLDATGRFVGGLILPGHGLMRQSLVGNTANLPIAQGSITDFPDGTHDAITSGVAAAQAGAVVRQWLAGRERFGRVPVLHASGGAWLAIEHEVRRLLEAAGSTQSLHVVDNPVLDGLACLAQAEPDLLIPCPPAA